MFTNERKVLFVSKDEIEGAIVILGKMPKIKKSIKMSWNQETLVDSLKQLVKKLSINNAYLLLNKDLSYVVEITIPTGLDQNKERMIVFSLISELIPENLMNYPWDYKQLEVKNNEKRIVAFAPIVRIYQMVSAALRKAGCRIDAVEPEQVALLRNANPIVGIALKKDISGKDSDVLNIKLLDETKEKLFEDQKTNMPVVLPTNTTKVRPQYLVVLFVISILAIITTSILFNSRKNTIFFPEKPVSTPEISELPSPTPLLPASITDSVIFVRNDIEASGEAEYVANLLKNAGFSTINIEDPVSSNSQKTIIEAPVGTNASELTNLVKNLLIEYVVEINNQLTTDSGYDLLITVGKKNVQ